jgi:hypothetical protein
MVKLSIYMKWPRQSEEVKEKCTTTRCLKTFKRILYADRGPVMPASDIRRTSGQFYWDDVTPVNNDFWASNHPKHSTYRQADVHLPQSTVGKVDGHTECSRLTGYTFSAAFYSSVF